MDSRNKKAISIIEYTLLILIVIGALISMRSYMQRTIFGNWKAAGTGVGLGRQYDPQKTIECEYDQYSKAWYDRNCFDYYINTNHCNGDWNCMEGVITGQCGPSSGSYCTGQSNAVAPPPTPPAPYN